MRIEAFTEAKRPAQPDTNEDALLILPGRAFAVLDGVSDRIGNRYDGMLAGRYASQLLQRTLEQLLSGPAAPLDDPWAVVQAAVAAIGGAYDRLGITEQVRGNWNLQMASTMALAMLSGDRLHVALVGDTGLRLNGETVLHEEKDLDFITAALRQQAWAPISARLVEPGDRERLSRHVAWSGTRHAATDVLTREDLDAIEAATMQLCTTRLAHVPQDDVLRMVQGGIINGQGGYQNNRGSVLGYPSLNGFEIPREMVRVESFARADVRSIELFSDGYFALGDGFGVAAWELMFAHVERVDPHKILHYPSPKGSADGMWSDDRTYLGVAF
jgi:hypothetical protein